MSEDLTVTLAPRETKTIPAGSGGMPGHIHATLTNYESHSVDVTISVEATPEGAVHDEDSPAGKTMREIWDDYAMKKGIDS